MVVDHRFVAWCCEPSCNWRSNLCGRLEKTPWDRKRATLDPIIWYGHGCMTSGKWPNRKDMYTENPPNNWLQNLQHLSFGKCWGPFRSCIPHQRIELSKRRRNICKNHLANPNRSNGSEFSRERKNEPCQTHSKSRSRWDELQLWH